MRPGRQAFRYYFRGLDELRDESAIRNTGSRKYQIDPVLSIFRKVYLGTTGPCRHFDIIFVPPIILNPRYRGIQDDAFTDTGGIAVGHRSVFPQIESQGETTRLQKNGGIYLGILIIGNHQFYGVRLPGIYRGFRFQAFGLPVKGNGIPRTVYFIEKIEVLGTTLSLYAGPDSGRTYRLVRTGNDGEVPRDPLGICQNEREHVGVDTLVIFLVFFGGEQKIKTDVVGEGHEIELDVGGVEKIIRCG